MVNAMVWLFMLKQNKIIQYKIVWNIYQICSHFCCLSFACHMFISTFRWIKMSKNSNSKIQFKLRYDQLLEKWRFRETWLGFIKNLVIFKSNELQFTMHPHIRGGLTGLIPDSHESFFVTPHLHWTGRENSEKLLAADKNRKSQKLFSKTKQTHLGENEFNLLPIKSE